MSESGLRGNLVRAMASLDATPIENRLRAGTPDINFIGGWMECKYKKFYPVKCENRPINFSHPLTIDQCLWIKRRCSKGGDCYVAIQISRDWFFFKGTAITDLFNTMTKPQMIENADLYLKGRLDKERLLKWLTK